MRILVTGLGGFTGGYVQAELRAHGHQVSGLSCDLTDGSAVADEIAKASPEAVLHLAAIAYVDHGNANAFYEVNLVGTRNLLAAISKNAPNIRSVMLASSANIYGNNTAGELDEKTPANPANDYAVSKFAMEMMAQLWSGRLPLFIVRPFNYTGVGQDKKYLIPKIISHFMAASETIELGNLEVSREFGDVRAVASIYRKLLEKNPVGKTLNICTGKAYSLRQVIELCEKITGRTIKVRINPEFIRPNEVRKLSGSNAELKKLIGDWEAFDLEETLTWMLAH